MKKMKLLHYETPKINMEEVKSEQSFMSTSTFTPPETGGNAGDIETGESFGDNDIILLN